MRIPYTPRTFCLLFGLVGIGIWVFGALSSHEGPLAVTRFLFHGVLGAVFWLLAGLAFTRAGENVGGLLLVLGVLAVIIWAVPSLIFLYSGTMALNTHLRIWSLIYLGGLVWVVVSVVVRALRTRRNQRAQ